MIVSDDAYNMSNVRTVTVAAVSSNLRRATVPGNVVLPAAVSGLACDSVVNVTQLNTLDRGALDERVGDLPRWLMAQLDDGLRRALGL